MKKRDAASLTLPQTDGHVDLKLLMKKLGEEQIDSILLEGGGTLNWAAFKKRNRAGGAYLCGTEALWRRGGENTGGRSGRCRPGRSGPSENKKKSAILEKIC